MKRRFNRGSAIGLGMIHLAGIAGLIKLLVFGASKNSLILAAFFWVVTGLGVTVGYHRMETHGSFKSGNVTRWLLFACGAMTLQGEVIGWVLNHRVHHRYTDQKGLDPHSPREYPGIKGLMWAHAGWLLFHYERPAEYKTNKKLEADKVAVWHRKNYPWFAVLSYVLPWIISGFTLDGLLIASAFRIMVGLNITWSVNSVCHWIGTRSKDSAGNKYLADDSRNNILVAILGFGEGYHANHHAYQWLAYHGWKWYSIDASKWLIRLLELLKLATDVKKPKKNNIFKPWMLRPIIKPA